MSRNAELLAKGALDIQAIMEVPKGLNNLDLKVCRRSRILYNRNASGSYWR